MTERQEALIFLHNQRCGGNVVNVALTHLFGARTFKAGVLGDAVNGLDAFRAAAENPEIRFFVGHFRYGAHAQLERPSRYFVNLRHPLGRVCSAYRCDLSGHGPFAAWLGAGFEAENGMVKRLAGVPAGPAPGDDLFDPPASSRGPAGAPVDDALFARALHTLETECVSILLQERLDETLLLFEEEHGLPPLINPAAVVYNPTPPGSAIQAGHLPAVLCDEILERNRYDLRLYARASELVDAELERRDAAFHERVRIRRLFRDILADPSGAPADAGDVTRRIALGAETLIRAGLPGDAAALVRLFFEIPLVPAALAVQVAELLAPHLPPAERDMLAEVAAAKRAAD